MKLTKLALPLTECRNSLYTQEIYRLYIYIYAQKKGVKGPEDTQNISQISLCHLVTHSAKKEKAINALM